MKIKPLTKEQITISIDRLTRFKNPEEKYLRVFKDIITHNLIAPVFSKNDLDKMDYNDLKNYAQEIINYSISLISQNSDNDNRINKLIIENEKRTFYINEQTEKLLDNKIDYENFIKFLQDKNQSLNLQYLKSLALNNDIKKERALQGFKFPVDILLLVEGATEETLLPEFARLCGFDFNKNGVHIIPAGGKNQVVKLYYEYSEQLKIPIFVLFDKDGENNAYEIYPKLRKNDFVYIIKKGEFEDILSEELVKRSLNKALENISIIDEEIVENTGHRVEYLEEIFKKRGMHEFKKVEFSQIVKSALKTSDDLTPEIIEIIDKIKEIKNIKY